MKHRILIAAAVALICSLTVFGACALGDTLALNGTVTRADTVTVYAPIGGVVGSVKCRRAPSWARTTSSSASAQPRSTPRRTAR